MPGRNFNASAEKSPSPGSRYMVSRDDTLWQIASRARPEGASVHQTMLDIQRLNPDAFINNNINRVKAGYIIYLPSADDISSEDLASALAEVRQQNEAWREGKDAELAGSAGPSLRISADETQDEASEEGLDTEAADHQAGTAALTGDDAGTAPTEGASRSQIAAMEERLETLQRIVDLKDDQIAALQSALAEAQARGDSGEDDTGTEVPAEGADDTLVAGESGDEPGLAGDDGDDTAGPESEADTTAAAEVQAQGQPDATADADSRDAEPAAAVKTVPTVTTRDTAGTDASAGSPFSYLWYVLGAAILALLAFLMLKRRRDQDEEEELISESEDVFSTVELKDQELAVEEESPEPEPVPVVAPASTRGYGERRHDGYASDMEAADALAEADIYIAYGRHPQAIDLLNNALSNEPNNPVYRLKLLEIYTELNDRGAAMKEFERIRSTGDSDSIARAEELLTGLDAERSDASVAGRPEPAPRREEGPGLAPSPIELVDDEGDEGLESDFSDLEIEPSRADEEDELDLSADFESEDDDEELVIAADSNGLSTKLDLARAYLDMGDEEGARQILDEIIAEGNDELKAEARTLLDRIG